MFYRLIINGYLCKAILTASSGTVEINERQKEEAGSVLKQEEELLRW